MTRARDAADQINRVNSSAADANAITIDSSENVLVGTTTAYPGSSSSANVVGVSIENAYGIHSSANGHRSLLLNRMTSDGTIAEFRKDATTVGSIASRAGAVTSLILDPRSGGGGLTAGGPALYPTDNAGSPSNGALSLGDASAKFKDLYLSGGVFLGGTGAANKISDYEDGTYVPTLLIAASTSGITQASSNGTYTKVGKLVCATFRINLSSKGSNTGALTISLPFTARAVSGAQGGMSVASYLANFTGVTNNILAMSVAQADGVITLFQVTTGGSVSNANLNNNSQIAASVTYYTA